MTIRSVRMAALVLLCACADAKDRAAAREPDPVRPDTVVRKADVGSLDIGGTLLDSVTVDVDGDGTAERIDLGVNAGRDERGEMQWDIHNQWSVIVRDGPDSYPLLHECCPGSAAFWVIAADSTRPAEILVQTVDLTTSRGGTRLAKFVFDRARGGYVRTGLVEGWGHRAFYRGPSEPKGSLLAPTDWRGDDPNPR